MIIVLILAAWLASVLLTLSLCRVASEPEPPRPGMISREEMKASKPSEFDTL